MKMIRWFLFSLVGFIAGSLAIISFVIDHNIFENPADFFKDPIAYIKNVKETKLKQQAKEIAKEQVEILKKEEEERKKREAERLKKLKEEEKRRIAEAAKDGKNKEKKNVVVSSKTKDRRITPIQKTESQTLIIIFVLLIALFVIVWAVFKYVINKKPPKDNASSNHIVRNDGKDDEDDHNDLFQESPQDQQ